MDLLVYVGRRVRELRKRKHMSQLELGQHAGVSPRQVARLEAGGANITLTTLDSIAGALDSRAALLFPSPRANAGARRQAIEALADAAEQLPDVDVEVLVRLAKIGVEHRLPFATLIAGLQEGAS